jgi:small conductance mechanosensitive channel
MPVVESWLRILAVVVVAYLLHCVAGNIFYRLVRRSQEDAGSGRDERKKRADTLAGAARGGFSVLVFAGATLTIMRQLGYEVIPILGAGFVGAAVGFGSQHLVRDLINGFFIVAENQYRVGDEVTTQGVSGTVEQIGLRATTLRDINGDVYIISNGTIELATNMTKGMGQALIDVRVPHTEDLERVYGVLDIIGQDLRDDPEIGLYVLEKPRILGIEDMNDTGVTVRVVCKTSAAWKWVVARQLRQRIKDPLQLRGDIRNRFQAHGSAAKPLRDSAQGR